MEEESLGEGSAHDCVCAGGTEQPALWRTHQPGLLSPPAAHQGTALAHTWMVLSLGLKTFRWMTLFAWCGSIQREHGSMQQRILP